MRNSSCTGNAASGGRAQQLSPDQQALPAAGRGVQPGENPPVARLVIRIRDALFPRCDYGQPAPRHGPIVEGVPRGFAEEERARVVIGRERNAGALSRVHDRGRDARTHETRGGERALQPAGGRESLEVRAPDLLPVLEHARFLLQGVGAHEDPQGQAEETLRRHRGHRPELAHAGERGGVDALAASQQVAVADAEEAAGLVALVVAAAQLDDGPRRLLDLDGDGGAAGGAGAASSHTDWKSPVA